jgi:hypothetical protein
MTGERFLVRHFTFTSAICLIFPTETMAENRAKSLSALLSTALATGYSEIEPDLEPLKVCADLPSRANGISNRESRILTPTLQ